MKSKEEFKERFENGEFAEELSAATSAEDIVEIARSLGYELTVEDVFATELSDDMLDAVAGGKGDTNDNSVRYETTINGNNNIYIG